MSACIYPFICGPWVAIENLSIRLVQFGDVWEEVRPSVQGELEWQMRRCGEGLRYLLNVCLKKKKISGVLRVF